MASGPNGPGSRPDTTCLKLVKNPRVPAKCHLTLGTGPLAVRSARVSSTGLAGVDCSGVTMTVCHGRRDHGRWEACPDLS